MSDAQPPAGKQMQRDLLFPTPVYFTDLANGTKLNEALIPQIRAWRHADTAGVFRTNEPRLGGWHSRPDMHTRREYDPVTREIFELMHGVYVDLGYDLDYEPVCNSMWANINPPHASNRYHTHPHSLFSGVYYVQVPDNCGLLYFTDPRPQTTVAPPHYDPQRRSPLTWLEVNYQPLAGRLMVFPAWLPHAVQPNFSTDPGPGGDRISISFNFHQRRRSDKAPVPIDEVVREDLDARS